ncbi:site-specific DNA-methyltransferase [uncultured Corynebacterium sp.]|uniref:site-specific DNA-methyltransferase n=1 Tax=uncultured Corynebacterium sp. TaxID=159447 RepID=UPI00259247FE|nr:site-specific DNA-methyltransferase [uncultured Corynebacterium sp.]
MNDDINYIPSNTPDFQTELAEKLAELAPEAIADGKIDVEKLKELLADDADESNERFGLFWPGKRRALRAAQQPTTATLKPDVENSKDWDTTKNVFIEGDNLEVLKVLQKHYHGKIKMIYIDPPYNTGKDFVYPDNFKEGLDTYLEWTKQVNDEGKKLSTNSESEGRYHSNWLNMMYPRLKLARNLLTNDGAIFISIDENEYVHLKRICDEIFGERNHAGTILWKKKSNGTSLGVIPPVHDYVLVYARDIVSDPIIGRPATTREVAETYSNPDDDPRGPWTTMDLGANHEGPWFEITNPTTGKVYTPAPGRYWVFNSAEVEKRIADGRIIFGKTGLAGPIQKKFLSERGEVRRAVDSWWDDVEKNSDGQKALAELMGHPKLIDHPKPVGLIRKILLSMLRSQESAIVLDFFAGSSTTAHAVMQLNAEDDGNRRHIQVQLPEPTPDKSESRKAGYATIAGLSRERIRRAGEKIRQDFSEQLSQRDTPLDVGFRAYKLSDTNFSKWHVSSDTPANELEQHLFELRESANDNATPADLFVELLLKQGYSLTEDIGDVSIAGLDLKTVLDADGDVAVLAYLNEYSKPTLDQLREIADSKPVRFVILEDCFQGDDELKTNLVQICKTNGIELWTA